MKRMIAKIVIVRRDGKTAVQIISEIKPEAK
jgi:hypothetical protein